MLLLASFREYFFFWYLFSYSNVFFYEKFEFGLKCSLVKLSVV